LVLKTDKVYIHHFEGSSIKKNKLNYRPMLYKNNRILLDKWNKELWSFIEKSNEPLSVLSKKYWLIRELVLSAKISQIPKKYLAEYKKVKRTFTSTV